ncbi:PVC-type heme-binding CxxCH protein [Lignipirellula cremea]|uniref:Gluconolactonase n=1 Tax=Lignipirellula cremea TaxID=2528010 RepID=A0A518DSA3_9BACT|nr:PVC-type heme-binding CxxCH protein [Lignipirellula cremea]QDU94719.1 Gluconolactonase precursor [Lignipirellula cremea]
MIAWRLLFCGPLPTFSLTGLACLAVAWTGIAADAAENKAAAAPSPTGAVVKLHDGFEFTEGPAADGQGNLYFTDIPNSRIHKVHAQGKLTTFLENSGKANGLMFDSQGQLYACRGGARQIARIDPATQAITSLVENTAEAPVGAPNDLVLDRAGGVYFTDPGANEIYYLSAKGKLSRFADGIARPNGVILSPDEKTLYVIPSGQSDMIAYDVPSPGQPQKPRTFCTLEQVNGQQNTGGDGATVDEHGNLYIASRAGVQVFDPQGKPLSVIRDQAFAYPLHPSNLTFGGPHQKTLFITARKALYAVEMNVAGHRFTGLVPPAKKPEPQAHAPEGEPETQALAPLEAARTMITPEGFTVNLFAGEPEVRQPISFCIDDRGRIWVAEAYNYPFRDKEPQDRILILEDTDGDGTADKRTVFYDKLGYVTGIEVGFGGVWVMSPPEMLFIPDRDGDDKPDGPPEVLLDGFGNTTSAHNIANGFSWGPDGWLYAGHGRTSPSDVGPPGTPAEERIHFDGGVYRYHPTRHLFEGFCDGTTNPWGVDFDDYGQAFISNCVNPHLFHAIQGAHYEPWRNRPSSQYAYERVPTIADHLHWVGEKPLDSATGAPEQLALGGGHAHCGTMVYLGDNWPDRYRNTVMMGNIHGHRINNDFLQRNGSTYTATHGPDVMIAADPWFKAVTLQYGPDGAVYVSDWSDTGECHDYKNTQRQTGRIFKMSYGGFDAVRVDMAGLSNDELVARQLHKNDWHVRHARRVLQERSAAGDDMTAVHQQLRQMFAENADPTRKLRALWALFVTGGADDDFLLAQLSHENEYVRAWAVRLLTEGDAVTPAALKEYARLAADDPSPVVRLHLASAVTRLPLDDRWSIVEQLVQHEEDADDTTLPLMFWYGLEPLVPHDKARAVQLLRVVKIPKLRTFLARRAATRE